MPRRTSPQHTALDGLQSSGRTFELRQALANASARHVLNDARVVSVLPGTTWNIFWNILLSLL